MRVSDPNLSLEGFALFIASSFYMISIMKRSEQKKEKNSNVEPRIQVKERALKKYRHNNAPILADDKFPWEAAIRHAPFKPLLYKSAPNGPLLCTFITKNTIEESMDEKLRAVAKMMCYRGTFNVACPCCK